MAQRGRQGGPQALNHAPASKLVSGEADETPDQGRRRALVARPDETPLEIEMKIECRISVVVESEFVSSSEGVYGSSIEDCLNKIRDFVPGPHKIYDAFKIVDGKVTQV